MSGAFVSTSDQVDPPVEGAPAPSFGPEEAEERRPSQPPLVVWQPTLRARIREAWDSRHLLAPLGRSAIPTYDGLILGRAWHFIIPIMQVTGFSVLFGVVLGASAPNDVPYILYLIFGLLAFRVLQMTLTFTTVSTKMLKAQTRALRFPLLLIPFTALARAFVVLAVYWAVAAVVLIYYAVAKGTLYLQLNLHFLAGIAGLALVMLLALAIGLTTSVIYPRARDVRYFVRYAVQFWMFFTPIVYALQALPPGWQSIAQANPLTPIIGLVQYGFLDAGWVRPWGLAWSLAAILLIGSFGVWFFNRNANAWIGVYQFSAEPEQDEEDLF